MAEPPPVNEGNPRGPATSDRGSVTPLVVACTALLGLVAAAAVVAGGYYVAARSARTAADAVALSAALTMATGDEEAVCRQAEVAAARNRVHVMRCRVTGAVPELVVEVTVQRAIPVRWSGLPRSVTATSYAGSAGLAES